MKIRSVFAFVVGCLIAQLSLIPAGNSLVQRTGPSAFFFERRLADGSTFIAFGTGKSASEVMAGIPDKVTAHGNDCYYHGKTKFGKIMCEYKFAVLKDYRGLHMTPRIKSLATGKLLIPEVEEVIEIR